MEDGERFGATAAVDVDGDLLPDLALRGTSLAILRNRNLGARDPDCNRNGIPDSCDIAAGTSENRNGDGIPDDCGADRFHRADPDDDGRTLITDAILLFRWLFIGGRRPACLESADIDDHGRVDVTDGILVLNYLFRGGKYSIREGRSRPSVADGSGASREGFIKCGCLRLARPKPPHATRSGGGTHAPCKVLLT